jgi:hypothetical protein
VVAPPRFSFKKIKRLDIIEITLPTILRAKYFDALPRSNLTEKFAIFSSKLLNLIPVRASINVGTINHRPEYPLYITLSENFSERLNKPLFFSSNPRVDGSGKTKSIVIPFFVFSSLTTGSQISTTPKPGEHHNKKCFDD